MIPTLRNMWRMYLLEFQKVGWDILGAAYVVNAMILFYSNMDMVACWSMMLSAWIALRLYFPFGVRQRMEYEACLPVSWVCVASARFCVLASTWVLLFVLPTFLLDDGRGVRMVGWLARHLPEGNAFAVIYPYLGGIRYAGGWSPWLWLNSQSGVLLFTSLAAAVVLHVPRWWKAVALVVFIAAGCALVWVCWSGYGDNRTGLYHGVLWHEVPSLWLVAAWFWPVNIVCALVLLLVKATPFTKRRGVL